MAALTKLTKPIKREITIDGRAYKVTLSDYGIILVRKRQRQAIEFRWKQLAGSGKFAKILTGEATE